jgi:hypothetical protein
VIGAARAPPRNVAMATAASAVSLAARLITLMFRPFPLQSLVGGIFLGKNHAKTTNQLLSASVINTL